MEYPKTFENPTIINHDEIMTIDVSFQVLKFSHQFLRKAARKKIN